MVKYTHINNKNHMQIIDQTKSAPFINQKQNLLLLLVK